MDQIARENCSMVSAKETLPEFEINDRQVRYGKEEVCLLFFPTFFLGDDFPDMG